MKNGDPRSQKWIARQMKHFHRDDASTHTLLLMVDMEPPVSPGEIRIWTDEQCMLAEDWAGAIHLSASDNNNRIPAVPDHLVGYRRRYPQVKPEDLAIELIKVMQDDNCVHFNSTDSQLQLLIGGVRRMQTAGCFFTPAEVNLFAAGEETERESHFTKFDGFAVANQVLNDIFDEVES